MPREREFWTRPARRRVKIIRPAQEERVSGGRLGVGVRREERVWEALVQEEDGEGFGRGVMVVMRCWSLVRGGFGAGVGGDGSGVVAGGLSGASV